jgi:hypothetical protein
MGSASAFASDEFSGVIERIDIPARQLVLDGERIYPVARGINLAKYRVGERIAIRTEDFGGKKDLITKIKKGDYFPPAPPKQSSRNRSIP